MKISGKEIKEEERMKKLMGIIAIITAVFGITAAAADAAALIGEARAKEIALKHAGVAAQQANFTKMKLDRDFGKTEYELEFYADNVKYEYDIDASSGAVIKFSREVKRGAPKNAADQQGLISLDRAKQIVLARIPGAKDSNIKEFELDYDHGQPVYEGEVIHNMREYEFEMDARTGDIIEWDVD